jgi:hypothetical protein
VVQGEGFFVARAYSRCSGYSLIHRRNHRRA